jgi:hypothetical protein
MYNSASSEARGVALETGAGLRPAGCSGSDGCAGRDQPGKGAMLASLTSRDRPQQTGTGRDVGRAPAQEQVVENAGDAGDR